MQPGQDDGKPLEIALDLIERNPFQTRAAFDDAKLAELASSIASAGVVQPIVVRIVTPTTDPVRYQLIMGERRWLASRRAGKSTIPAIVRQVSDEQALQMTIIENLQRADLNPMEQAKAYQRLSQQFHMTQEEVAQRTGAQRATVTNFLRLLKLPSSVQQKVQSGELSFGHARTLLALESTATITSAAQRVIATAMSVRQTETYVRSLLDPEEKQDKPGKIKEPLDPNVREAQDLLQRSLGLRVSIKDHKGRGRVVITYTNVNDFDTILSALGRMPED